MLAVLLLAIKFHEDQYMPNSDYAQIGGVKTGELNQLESELLQIMHHRLYIPEPKMQKVEEMFSD